MANIDQATMQHLSVIAQAWRFSLFSHIAQMTEETNVKKILTVSPLRELEETTRTPPYYVDEAEIQQPLPE